MKGLVVGMIGIMVLLALALGAWVGTMWRLRKERQELIKGAESLLRDGLS